MSKTYTLGTKLKFFLLSLIGIIVFFVPIEVGGKSTILLDHSVTWIKIHFSSFAPYYALAIIVFGALMPFINKTWNKSKIDIFFSIFKIIGVVVACMAIFQIGPKILFEPDMIPFLFNKLVIPVGIIVPIGAIFLSFLIGYGLLEFIGVIMEPVMKPIWKTPGKSAIDAVASFVGSYSIGLLITNRVFKEGKYNIKEACIIATGFSTVSATFMIIVAKTLGIMEHWNMYFWTTLLITFIVTAITSRIWPLSKKSEKYYNNLPHTDVNKHQGNILLNAWHEGMMASEKSKPFFANIFENLKDGIKMAMGILPSILSVGLLGLLLAKYTPVFDILGYIFYPFTALLGFSDPMLMAKASALGIAEMFLPALLVVEADIITKFVIGVVSVSSILFFSASIPCIVSTEIPISIKEIVIIWAWRTILTILLATPIAYIVF